jgi:hypothetical protein
MLFMADTLAACPAPARPGALFVHFLKPEDVDADNVGYRNSVMRLVAWVRELPTKTQANVCVPAPAPLEDSYLCALDSAVRCLPTCLVRRMFRRRAREALEIGSIERRAVFLQIEGKVLPNQGDGPG